MAPVGRLRDGRLSTVPFRTLAQKLVSAILMGNTCVLVASSTDVLSAKRFVEIIDAVEAEQD
jgi:acyl-CoA reductase-like NAD-dependent aldehyde dehydrogenase